MTLGSAARRTLASCLFVAAVAAALAAARAAEAQEQPKTRARHDGGRVRRGRLPQGDARLVLSGSLDDAGRAARARPLEGGRRRAEAGAARGRPADEGPGARGQRRTRLHLPRRRKGPVEHPAGGAARHLRRGPAARPDGGAAPGGRADRGRARRRRRASRPSRSASWCCPTTRRSASSATSSRRLPGTFSEYPTAATAAHPGLRRRHRDRRPPDALREARREPGRPGRAPRVPARAPLRRVHLGLRPPPEAVALDAAAGRRAVAPDPRGPRPGLRPLRRLPRPHGGEGRTPGSRLRHQLRPHLRAHRTTAASRTAGCSSGCRARRGTRRPQTLQAAFTDEVLERAARRMPDEWYKIDGARLVAALKQRRADLVKEADVFYEFLAHQADVQATNAPELARVKRQADGGVEIQVARLGAAGRRRRPTSTGSSRRARPTTSASTCAAATTRSRSRGRRAGSRSA